jgi:DNA-directed RNA polymerase subunit RPC12/RpoP
MTARRTEWKTEWMCPECGCDVKEGVPLVIREGRIRCPNCRTWQPEKVEGDRPMSEADGGQIATVIRAMRSLDEDSRRLLTVHKTPYCPGERRSDPVLVLLGYPHDGGLADSSGRRWWLFARCADCGYDTSWHPYWYARPREASP